MLCSNRRFLVALGCIALLASAGPSSGLEPGDSELHRMQFEDPSLRPDPAAGGHGSRTLRIPLIPGGGAGNHLAWEGSGLTPPADEAEWGTAAERAIYDYLGRSAGELRLDPSEIERPLRVTVHRGGDLIQLRGRRRFLGLPVHDSLITAVISHGNLILLGWRNWAPIEGLRLEPGLDEADALHHVERFLAGWTVRGTSDRGALVIVPGHRLAWMVRPVIAGSRGRWEAIVDATDGSILSFVDRNRYQSTRTVSGGVFPVSNDGASPDGIEQPGWPMPFAFVGSEAGTLTADSSGHLPLEIAGDISTDLTGPFAAIEEGCGAIFESSPGDLDLGSGPGTNCDVPPGGSAGNTHAARTTFYELNRVKEVARGHLPANGWLQQQLTAVTNDSFSCGALWNGEQIRLGGGNFGCASTGEVAGVVDHEWAHGMDQNDASGAITSPAEGIADVYAALRLNTSCIGRGMLPFVCSGYGDPCLTCDGVRDVDWAERTSGQPHDIDWVVANCTPGGFGTPCGRQDHCESVVVSEAIWDLYRRTLPAPPFELDSNTALELATRLTFLGAGAVDDWYTCDGGGGAGDGCNADGGYLNYLAADDDNGDLGDGTPHMQAIFDAFDAHGIACSSPVVQNSGCQGGPGLAPQVAAQSGDRSVELTWDAVPGARSYRVFRTEGVFECDFSKVGIGETALTSFVDTEVRNDFDVYYTVAAIGPADSCLGPMSACTPATPTADSGLEIFARGSCPGTVRVRVNGAAPGSPITLALARQPGTFAFPSGPCAGTELDLQGPRLVGKKNANGQGIANFSFPLQGSCGALVQALDGASCETSPVAQTP